MTGLKTMTEYEVLEYAYMELSSRVQKYQKEKELYPNAAELCDIAIEGYDEKLQELEAAMAAALKEEEARA